MEVKGKGYFTWKLIECEGGDAQEIVETARAANLSHVLVKIADGADRYNISVDLPLIVRRLQEAGILVLGWHYTYGGVWIDRFGTPHYGGPSPAQEALVGGQYALELGVDGYVIDAEVEYKYLEQHARAASFMRTLRAVVGPEMPVALSSYRYPSLHPQLPWVEFMTGCNINMPQVYWMMAHNPAEQLERCVAEFSAMTPRLPIIPTGATFTERGWAPTEGEVTAFLAAAERLGLEAVNFWEWSDARRRLPGLWEAVANYEYEGTPPEPPPAGPGMDLVVLTEGLRIRSRPNTSAQILGYLSAGEVITGNDLSGSEVWVKVRTESGLEGWAAFHYGGGRHMRAR